MIDNNLYNLMMQMIIENKSLYRIKNNYMKDAAGSQEDIEFWKKLEKDKEQHVNELKEKIKIHMN
jgi:hypothetical protein